MKLIKANNLDELIKKSKGKTLLNASETLKNKAMLDDGVRVITSNQLYLGDRVDSIDNKEQEIFETIDEVPTKNYRYFVFLFDENILFKYKSGVIDLLDKKLKNYELITSKRLISKISNNNNLDINGLSGVYFNKKNSKDYIIKLNKKVNIINEKKDYMDLIVKYTDNKTFESYLNSLNSKERDEEKKFVDNLSNTYWIRYTDSFEKIIYGDSFDLYDSGVRLYKHKITPISFFLRTGDRKVIPIELDKDKEITGLFK